MSFLSERPISPSTQDLKVVHDDDQIVVIDKPAGVLSTPGKDGNASLQQAVFDAYGCESGNANKMACHRLGMDTSGLMVFAKTDHALRDLNAQFRTRKVGFGICFVDVVSWSVDRAICKICSEI